METVLKRSIFSLSNNYPVRPPNSNTLLLSIMMTFTTGNGSVGSGSFAMKRNLSIFDKSGFELVTVMTAIPSTSASFSPLPVPETHNRQFLPISEIRTLPGIYFSLAHDQLHLFSVQSDVSEPSFVFILSLIGLL